MQGETGLTVGVTKGKGIMSPCKNKHPKREEGKQYDEVMKRYRQNDEQEAMRARVMCIWGKMTREAERYRKDEQR